MLVEGKIRGADRREKQAAGVTFRHFRRLLGYVWPHRRYLYPAIGFVLLMAATYSASIGAAFPVLKVIVEDEGLHGWVDRYIVEKRLKCSLTMYDSQRHGKIVGVPERTAKLLEIKNKSPFAKTDVTSDDFILGVTGEERVDSIALFKTLAEQPPGDVSLTLLHREDQSTRDVIIVLPEMKWRDQMTRNLVYLFPAGTQADQRMHTIFVVLITLLCVVLIGNVSRICAEYLTILIISRAVLDLRKKMYSHVLSMPLSHFSTNTSDTLGKFIQDMNDIYRGLNNFFQKMIAEPFKAIGVVGIAVWLNWKLTLFIMLGAPIAIFVFRKMGKKIRKANTRLLIGYGRMLGMLESTMSGMRVVKAYTRENHERKRVFQVDRHVLKQQLRMGFIESLASPLIEMLGFIAASAGILYLTNEIVNDKMDSAAFMTMLICLGAIFDPVRKLSGVYPKLQRANAAAARIFELLDTPTEYEGDEKRPAVRPLADTLELRNVTFIYEGTTTPAVDNVSLTIRRGETIAVVGPNGSGKTTLLSLLPKFFPINSGQILIDGQDTAEVSLRSLRRQFSLITQESVIFAETVASNIAYGKTGATQEEIESAARKAFADEFIREMPNGYQTEVGERGATLSGGQRQRISIARAILRDAPILIFDEATSQVDPESEMKIHTALETILENRTAFVIAHRYSTISNADRIVVMDRGRIVAVGPHAELLKSCELYARLYETQFRNKD